MYIKSIAIGGIKLFVAFCKSSCHESTSFYPHFKCWERWIFVERGCSSYCSFGVASDGWGGGARILTLIQCDGNNTISLSTIHPFYNSFCTFFPNFPPHLRRVLCMDQSPRSDGSKPVRLL
jgi:hypothetical protein